MSISKQRIEEESNCRSCGVDGRFWLINGAIEEESRVGVGPIWLYLTYWWCLLSHDPTEKSHILVGT